MKALRALVTGAAGFVGRHLIPILQEEGYDVWATWHGEKPPFLKTAHGLRADLTRLEEALKIVRVSRPDFVFHLAAFTSPRASFNNPAQVFQVNVAGSMFLMEAVIRFAPAARLLLVSSCHVYGRTFLRKKRVRENDPTDPVTPYGASKLLMEIAALNFFSSYDLQVVRARGFNQLGPGQDPDFAFSSFCQQITLMEEGRKPPVLETGNLNLLRDFLHVEDAARAYALLVRKGEAGQCYNVSSGKGITLREGVEFLRKRTPVRFRAAQTSHLARRDDFPSVLGDPIKLTQLGWKPARPFWEGLEALLEEWRRKVSRGAVI